LTAAKTGGEWELDTELDEMMAHPGIREAIEALFRTVDAEGRASSTVPP
jgi:hypothetical protein